MAIALSVQDPQGNQLLYNAHEQVSIGRDPSQATLVLDNEFVSRLHCVIQRRHNGQWVVIHRGRNPSRLDDHDLRRPGEQAILRERSALTVGGVRIEVVVDEDPPTELIDIGGVLDLPEFEAAWAGSEEDDESEHTLIEAESPYPVDSDEDDVLPWLESRSMTADEAWRLTGGSSSDGWNDRPLTPGASLGRSELGSELGSELASESGWKERPVSSRRERLPVKETTPLVIDVARRDFVRLQGDNPEDDEASLEARNPAVEEERATEGVTEGAAEGSLAAEAGLEAPEVVTSPTLLVATTPAAASGSAAAEAATSDPAARPSVAPELRTTVSMTADPAALKAALNVISAESSIPRPTVSTLASVRETLSDPDSDSAIGSSSSRLSSLSGSTSGPAQRSLAYASPATTLAAAAPFNPTPLATAASSMAASPTAASSLARTIAPRAAPPSGAFRSPVRYHRQSWFGALFSWIARFFARRET